MPTRLSSTAHRNLISPRATTDALQENRSAVRRQRSKPRRGDWIGASMAALALAIIIAGVLAPLVAVQDPSKQDLTGALQGTTRAHWLGTDQFGRDILARMLYGLRITSLVSGGSVTIGLAVGGALGVASGFWGGWVDGVLMRVIDILLAFPSLVLAMIVISILGPGLWPLVVALAVYSVPGFARVARGEVLRVKHLEFIAAAQAIGATEVGILRRHVIPNIYSQLTILATIRLGVVILVGASLGFLGLGVSPPTPELGAMLADGRTYMRLAPQLTIIPGLVISVLVLAVNMAGNWMRDRWDPRLRRS